MNLNELAFEIVEEEGKKINISIAQVKEVMKIVFTRQAKMSLFEIADILRRYQAKGGE